ncbi:alkaline phosphatase family protein [Methylosinus sp. KRF6]|uniref:alkaline phosphatase family protein n=1 Tax=Methylosinus sp. KRF6 TaxID=2846853 RepID=UPI001C0DCC63|nr:alkaline phosphatase family protein [Methylosinus sp. KRF6]MBU3889297.1 alkaline phosphatase family protein [Methylosinus sp. KRF6]
MKADANGGSGIDRLHQRIVILMCDGLGSDYFAACPTPTLKRWVEGGIGAPVRAVMPTVTNANNASICCGAWPSVHGVIGNSFLDLSTGAEEYMETDALLLAPTLFERAARYGVRSALLTSKKKTTSLLGRGADLLLAAEEPSAEWVQRLGAAPNIYSCEINYWLMRAAIDVLKSRPEIGVLYVHTTDYPMHMWPPEAPESKAHLLALDGFLAEAEAAAPDAAFLVSADHGMNYKTRCWDLEKALAARGAPVVAAISAERDKYLRHHRGMGGSAFVHLSAPADAERVAAALRGLEGVERVMTRAEAAQIFGLMAERIGDLVALGDKDTVFGHLDVEMERMPPEFRTHGSLHESDVPLIVHNARGAPEARYFRHNLDLARWLFPIAATEELSSDERS